MSKTSYQTRILLYLTTILLAKINYSIPNPVSPCPKLFQYKFDGTEWFGIFTLKNPPTNPTLQVKILLSLRGKPPANYLGEIELLSKGKWQSVDPVVYKIKFPLKSIPPRVTQILVNDRLVCFGSPDQGIFVTLIQLEHTRKLTFLTADVTSDTILHPEYYSHSAKITQEKSTLRSINEICGQTDISSRIKTFSPGADSISRGNWPWLAAIYINNLASLSYQCGGNLISSRIVISSAHCFSTRERKVLAEEVLIFLGRHNLRNWNEDGSVAAPCEAIFVHPDFDEELKSYDADIAVLVLKKNIRFTHYIRPVCLWSGTTDLDFITGEHGVIIGWGHDELASLSSTPRKASATIVSNSVCLKSNQMFSILTSNRTFCAGDRNGNGPCNGDSGVGLMIYHNQRWKIRGIVSASLPNKSKKSFCNLQEFIIYTDVAKFLDWIYAFLI